MKKAPVRDIPKITSFKDIMLAMAERDKTAYILPKGKELINLSYKDFYAMTLRLAKGITAVGLAGKRVAVIGETSPEWVATYLAIVVTGGALMFSSNVGRCKAFVPLMQILSKSVATAFMPLE